MNEKREKNLRKVRLFYIIINAILMGSIVLSVVLFAKLQLGITSILFFDLALILTTTIVNHDVFEFGIEKIANSDLTRNLLSIDNLTEVIPILPPDDEGFNPELYGTANTTFGNIHKNLVDTIDGSKFYAKLSEFRAVVEISRTYENEPGNFYVGSIRVEYFPYFYEIVNNQN